jgi:hypothetical protein
MRDDTSDERWCPSGRASDPQAVLFGVRTATDSEAGGPRVGYLTQLVPADAETLALAAPAKPTEVFRIGAPCAESECVHFEDNACSLAHRIVSNVPVVVSIAPACALRSRCRWWHQEGTAACLRCPVILTEESGANAEVAEAAMPRERERTDSPTSR